MNIGKSSQLGSILPVYCTTLLCHGTTMRTSCLDTDLVSKKEIDCTSLNSMLWFTQGEIEPPNTPLHYEIFNRNARQCCHAEICGLCDFNCYHSSVEGGLIRDDSDLPCDQTKHIIFL